METIAKFIKENCVYVPEEPMFGKAPGTRYKSQFYLSPLTTNGAMMNYVLLAFNNLLEEHDIDLNTIQFAGQVWSALPILGCLSMRYPEINTFIVRQERKNYGKNNIFEGVPDRTKKTILVDDLCNSTNSFVRCKSILENHGIPVHDNLLCILNKKNYNDVDFMWDKYSMQKSMHIVSRDAVI